MIYIVVFIRNFKAKIDVEECKPWTDGMQINETDQLNNWMNKLILVSSAAISCRLSSRAVEILALKITRQLTAFTHTQGKVIV